MYVEAGGKRLFAILTRPPGPSRDLGVLILGGGGYMFSAQRNRLPVRMSRRFAAEGLPALRFDYAGTGDSGGAPPPMYRLTEPFAEQGEAAGRALEGAGVDRYVLVGNCFGARSALAVAPRLAGVEGVVLIVPPVGNMEQGQGTMVSRLGAGMSLRSFAWQGVRQLWRGVVVQRRFRKHLRRAIVGVRLAFRAAVARITKRFRSRDSRWQWLSRQFVAAVDHLVQRRVPILVIYGETDAHLAHFRRAASSGPLADVLARAGDLFEVRTLGGEIEGFATLEAQEAVLGMIHEWVLRRAGQLEAADGPSAVAAASEGPGRPA
ncbi:MAG TPA: alpha/beta fold hydrolase [Actinomycetota bacterium]|nr:alpha/beta fold hydrolase [Actinomycetota bacterium]